MGIINRTFNWIEYRFLPTYFRNTLGLKKNKYFSNYCDEMKKIFKNSGQKPKQFAEIKRLKKDRLAVIGQVDCSDLAKRIDFEMEGVKDSVYSLEQDRAEIYASSIYQVLKTIDSKLQSFYGSYYSPYWIQIQRNNPGEVEAGSAFQWHTDDNPTGVMKVFIYLNEVKESNGAFRAFPKQSTTYLFFRGFRSNGIETRVRAQPLVNKFYEKNPKKLKILEGQMGTILGFDNNLVHKGTLPRIGYRHVVQILIYPSNKPLSLEMVVNALKSKRERDYPLDPYKELMF